MKKAVFVDTGFWKDFSITDCTSFVLMLQEGIQLYAGFDDHSQQMGFVSVLAHLNQTS